ncbi:MAG TPA: hypothetical protein VMV27_09925 [Candidatus Binataceae bacterium]|nr:hypothetical protein [Candidatus Binataceae bacterium]
MRTSIIKFRFRPSAAVTLATLVLSAAVLCARLAARAAELPASVDEYASALAAINGSRRRQSLEPVFEIAIQSSPQIQAILDTLSAAEFAALRKKMPGLQMIRGADAVVRPSADFFRNLARRKGLRADRAFFDIYARTEPDSSPVFPAYVTQRSDSSGCTRFDGPLLVGLYRGWLDFRTQYPANYTTEAQGEMDSMDAELAAGTCACGTKKQVAAGLEAFATAFPDLPLTQKIRKRIERIRAGASHIRFQCHPG